MEENRLNFGRRNTKQTRPDSALCYISLNSETSFCKTADLEIFERISVEAIT